jgi:hypothetical protein
MRLKDIRYLFCHIGKKIAYGEVRVISLEVIHLATGKSCPVGQIKGDKMSSERQLETCCS